MMSTDKKPAKKIYTLAAAIGLALGAMGVASAASTPAQPTVADQTQTQAPSVAPHDEASEVDGVGDEAVDGIDHQFEGEEIGENGDGIADANDADEVEADDEESDGIDHQSEGEEVGENGDGVADEDDASEATNNG